MSRHLAPLLLLIAAACSPGEKTPGRVHGTVTWEGRPVAMALVEAYPRPERDPTSSPSAEVPSAEDGRYTLDLPPGTYWLWAKATVTGGQRVQRLVGQAENSPIHVQAGAEARADLSLLDATGFATAGGPSGAGVRGTVSDPEPRRVTVYAYPGHVERPVGPGFVAAVAAGANGEFQIDLAPGLYSLAARWRATGADHGGLQPGDRVATAVVEVQDRHYTEPGPLELHPVDLEVWRSMAAGVPPTDTWVEGRVIDSAGNPKPGIRVLAFNDSRMAGKPLALGPPSDEDGRFRVYLPGAGRYFLGARSRIGGPAEPGEWNGAYRGEDGDGVPVAVGRPASGLEIRVEEVW